MGNIKRNIRPGQCYYEPYGRGFRIYRCEENFGEYFYATPLPDEPIYYNREEAKKRVYELNGWPTRPTARGNEKFQALIHHESSPDSH